MLPDDEGWCLVHGQGEYRYVNKGFQGMQKATIGRDMFALDILADYHRTRKAGNKSKALAQYHRTVE